MTALYVLTQTLEAALRLLHPFMPFITEEIWQKLPNHQGASIMIAPWVKPSSPVDKEAEENMTAIMETVKIIRNLRVEVGVPLGKRCEVLLNIADRDLAQVFADNVGYIENLATAEPVKFINDADTRPDNALTGAREKVTIYLPLKGLIDVEKETARLNKELAKLTAESAKLEKKLANESFLAKAPASVVQNERDKLAAYGEKRQTLTERIAQLTKLAE